MAKMFFTYVVTGILLIISHTCAHAQPRRVSGGFRVTETAKPMEWSPTTGIPYTQTTDAAWGATAFALMGNGKTAFLCANSHQLVVMDTEQGKRLQTIPLADWAYDVRWANGQFYVLFDRSVAVLSAEGKQLRSYAFSAEIPVRLEVGNGGLPQVLLADGNTLLLGITREATTIAGWPLGDGTFAESIRETDGLHYTLIQRNAAGAILRQATYESAKELGTVRVLGGNAGGIFLDVEAVQGLSVDRFMVFVAYAGERFGAVVANQIPFVYYTFVPRDWVVMASGVHYLMSTPAGIRLFSMVPFQQERNFPAALFQQPYHFNHHLPQQAEPEEAPEDRLIPGTGSKGGPNPGAAVLIPAQTQAIGRAQILTNADAFKNLVWTCNSWNIKNNWSCGGKTVKTPTWCASTGSKTAMPYMWGGWNSTSSFISGLTASGGSAKSAGDMNTATSFGAASCALGVDCSGFISQVWGLTTKYSTTTLNNISYTYSNFNGLLPGDIVNNSGSHVRLVSGLAANGSVNCIEASGSQWKVHVATYTQTNLSGYTPRYYNNLTPVPAVPALSSPANNATNVNTSSTFSWGSVSGATSYRLQISTSASSFSVLNGFTSGTTTTATVVINSTASGTSLAVTGLQPNTTYYWSVRAGNSLGGSPYAAYRTFTTAAAPPANNDICSATSLAVSANAVYTNGTLTNATANSPSPSTSNGCTWNGTNGDVWYKFTMPSAANATVRLLAGTNTNAQMAIYTSNTSSCTATRTFITCENNNTQSGANQSLMPVIQLTGGAGKTVWVQVWGYGSSATGTFQICVLNYISANKNDDEPVLDLDMVAAIETLDLPEVRSFAIYPNPTHGVFTLITPENFEQGELVITNLTGAIVFRQEIKGETVASIHPQLAPGVYLVRYRSHEGVMWNEGLLIE